MSDLSDLTNSEFRVLVLYSQYVKNDTLDTFVSQQTIADRAGMARENVNKVVKSLVAKKKLMFLPKKGRSNVMKLLIEEKKHVKENKNKQEEVSEYASKYPKCTPPELW